MQMKAISLWQPWASLIAFGAKRIETRSWSTPYRGPIAIHAARTKQGFDDVIAATDYRAGTVQFIEPFRRVLMLNNVVHLGDLPLGCIVAVCDLVDIQSTEHINALRQPISEQERAFGNFGPGRYGWILGNVRRLPEPIPYRGMQCLFNVELALSSLEVPRGS